MKPSTAIAAILTELARKGQLTPDNVVKLARSKRSPLHGRFEWDDSVAAHQRRCQQARELINSIKIDVRYHQITLTVPAFIVNPGPAGGYVAVTRLRDDKAAARRAVAAEFVHAANALARAERVAVALGLADEVAGLRRKLDAMANRLGDGKGKAA